MNHQSAKAPKEPPDRNAWAANPVHLERSLDDPVGQTTYFRSWFFGGFGALAVHPKSRSLDALSPWLRARSTRRRWRLPYSQSCFVS